MFAEVPAELCHRRQWVVWRREWRGGKTTKVPYRASGCGRASSTDAATWSTFTDAVGAACHFDGIALAVSPTDPYCAIDLDHCVDAVTGEIDSFACSVLERFRSYAELSPSRSGLHTIVRACKPGPRCRTGRLEMYDRDRFLTITGLVLGDWPIADRQNQVSAMYREFFPDQPTRTYGPLTQIADDDHALLERAHAARNGAKFAALWRGDTSAFGSDHSAADLALCSHLAFWTGCDPRRVDSLFRRSALMRSKWDAPRGATTYGAMTIARAVRGG
jgi:primase-polymerase (primpol)-like protein